MSPVNKVDGPPHGRGSRQDMFVFPPCIHARQEVQRAKRAEAAGGRGISAAGAAKNGKSCSSKERQREQRVVSVGAERAKETVAWGLQQRAPHSLFYAMHSTQRRVNFSVAQTSKSVMYTGFVPFRTIWIANNRWQWRLWRWLLETGFASPPHGASRIHAPEEAAAARRKRWTLV